jgi:hypothetical protein
MRPEVVHFKNLRACDFCPPACNLSTAFFISVIDRYRDAGVYFVTIDKMAPPVAPAAAAAQAQTETGGMSVSRKLRIHWQGFG